jgi:hypothetical protein
VDLLAHPIAERGVDELVLAHLGEPFECGADDHRLPVLAVAGDFEVLARQAGGDRLLDGFGRGHDHQGL